MDRPGLDLLLYVDAYEEGKVCRVVEDKPTLLHGRDQAVMGIIPVPSLWYPAGEVSIEGPRGRPLFVSKGAG